MSILCPACGSKEVGRVGLDQYYCWNCFVEYNDRMEVFDVTEEGSLVSRVDLAGEGGAETETQIVASASGPLVMSSAAPLA